MTTPAKPRPAPDAPAASSPPRAAGADQAARRPAVSWLRMPSRKLWLPAVAFAVVLAGWWAAVRVFDVPAFFVPAPPQIAATLAEHRSYLLHHAGETFGHALGGFGIASAAGVTSAMLLTSSTWVRDSLFPLVIAVQQVPKVSVAPLLVVWLGYGPSSKVVLVALLCFFPVVVSTVAGLSATPSELAELARSLSATRAQTLFKLRIPWAMPQVFTGLKIAISLALIGAVVAELNTPNAGLGAIIMRSAQAANTTMAFAAISLLSGIGITLYYSLVFVERLLLPWARATTA